MAGLYRRLLRNLARAATAASRVERVGTIAALPSPHFLVVGTPRSGTTLVQRLAAELDGVGFPPETHFFTEFAVNVCGKHRFPLDGAELRGVLETYAGRRYMRDTGFDVDAVHDTLAGSCISEVELFGAIVDHLAPDAPVRGEKTPGHLLWWLPLTRALPRLRIIAVVRDPRAVVASQLALGWSSNCVSPAQRWIDDVGRIADAGRELGPDRLLLVHYERAVREPRVVRADIAGLLEVPNHTEVGAVESRLRIPGWETWKSNALEDPDPDRIDHWRSLLSPEQERTVSKVCRTQMIRLGYVPPPEGRDTGSSLVSKSRLRIRRLEAVARRHHREREIARHVRRWPAPDQPRVLMLGLGWFPDQPGGLTRYLRDLTETLAGDRDATVRALVIGTVTGGANHASGVSAPDQPLPARLVRFAVAAGRAARAADVVDSHFALYAFPCLLVPAVRRRPMIVHFHGPWADEFVANGAPDDWRIALKRWVEKQVYRRAQAIVVLSEAFKDVVVEQFGIPDQRVHVIAPGVDLEVFSPGDRAAARAGLGLDAESSVCVCVRRLVPRMGHDVLLQAWAQARLDGTLLIVGDGPERSRLERLVGELGIGSSVRFLGPVDDPTLVSTYRAADVSVVPSIALEGFGLVVIESLACGTPVISSDVGGMAETLSQLDPTAIVASGDPAALSRRLGAALELAQLPPREQCRNFAEGFDWPGVGRTHRDLYAWARDVHG